MNADKEREIEKLYERCKLVSDENWKVKTKINSGMLNNQLNANFSGIYGKATTSNYSGVSIMK